METITRRVFLKRTIAGVGVVVLAKSLGSGTVLGQEPPADMSRVVVVEHPEATDGVRVINPANVQTMMDESIKELTGQVSVPDAWASLLPDFKQEHLVAIKVNAITNLLPTHPAVVDAIISGLIAAGVPDNNIIIYDALKTRAWKQQLNLCGYKYNAGDVGVRCIDVTEKGWGYDWGNQVTIMGRKMGMNSVVLRCDHLINVPVLKWLNWMPTCTLSLKNHYGSISAPDALHDSFAQACAALNNHEAIRDKTRLVVTDALFGNWKTMLSPPNFVPNSLILSRDPVAADYVGVQMLEEERARHDQPPGNIPFLDEAADLGLGTNDPAKMEVLKMALGPEKEEPEEEPEEEPGNAANPAGSHRTQ